MITFRAHFDDGVDVVVVATDIAPARRYAYAARAREGVTDARIEFVDNARKTAEVHHADH